MMPMAEPETLPFEQALQELERVLRDLEDGSTTLEESLARYERGIGLLRACYGQLRQAEQKIQILTGMTPDGKPDLQIFEHTAAVEKAAPTRRVKKPSDEPELPF
jgi:exodeoxyribonuclease VII small subunit